MQESVKEHRERYIGGSDVVAIMGLSKYKTRYQLLQEKAGIVEHKEADNPYTRYGNVMEEKIRDHINNCSVVYGEAPFHEDKWQREAIGSEPIGIRCHCDGINEITVLEIKTTSEIHENVDEYKYYLVQLLFYMIYFEKRYGMLAVYERPEDMSEEFDMTRLQIFHIDRSDYSDLIMEIGVEIYNFMRDLKRLKMNPFLEEQDFMPAELIAVSDKLLLLENKLAEMKLVEAQVKEFKEKLKEEMIKHKVKTWRTPNKTLITLVDDTPATEYTDEELDIEGLKRDLPELFKPDYDGGYMKTVTKTKKGKSGYVRLTFPKDMT